MENEPETGEPEEKQPEEKPQVEEPKEVDLIIKIPAKVRLSPSIQQMVADLIERIKVEMARQ